VLSRADETFSLRAYVLMSFSVFLVQLFFVGIGFFVSVFIRKIKSVMPVTLAVVFLFFIVEMINESLLEKSLTYLTPFAYFQGPLLISSLRYDPVYVVIDLFAFLFFTALSYLIYQKKDIHSV
jgi:ABC-2 type transport system permease protein